MSYKQKCPITAEEFEKIRRGDLTWIEADSRQLIQEVYIQMNLLQLKTLTVVDYKSEV